MRRSATCYRAAPNSDARFSLVSLTRLPSAGRIRQCTIAGVRDGIESHSERRKCPRNTKAIVELAHKLTKPFKATGNAQIGGNSAKPVNNFRGVESQHGGHADCIRRAAVGVEHRADTMAQSVACAKTVVSDGSKPVSARKMRMSPMPRRDRAIQQERRHG